jgi:FdhE protein
MKLTPPVIAVRDPLAVIVPGPELFAARAERFTQLATGHSLGDWLHFLAAISRAQQQALQSLPELPLPSAADLRLAHEHHMPAVPAQSWPRHPAWQDIVRQLATAVLPAAPPAAHPQLARLCALSAGELEALAERVLHAELYGEEAELLPYVGAALQVLWTGLAMRLGAAIVPLDVPGVCPCCGFLPVASMVKTVGEVANLRYLHCALCNTEWNLVRVKCAACDANEDISFYQLDGAGVSHPEAVRAEVCDSCMSYLKIVYQEKGGIDPVADDLATLPLDILVDEAGYARSGPNLLLVPGNG